MNFIHTEQHGLTIIRILIKYLGRNFNISLVSLMAKQTQLENELKSQGFLQYTEAETDI